MVSAGWAASTLAGGIGAVVGGFSGRLLGIWADEGPQGFALSLLGALAFVTMCHVLSRSRNRRVTPDAGHSPHTRGGSSAMPYAKDSGGRRGNASRQIDAKALHRVRRLWQAKESKSWLDGS
jgi:hypothetical protein